MEIAREPMNLVCSPQVAVIPFNPVLTPGQAAMSFSPIATTPLPYFTFSPVSLTMSQTLKPSLKMQEPQALPSLAAGPVASIPAAPKLLPPPESRKKARLQRIEQSQNLKLSVAELPTPSSHQSHTAEPKELVILPPIAPQSPRDSDIMSVKKLLSAPTTPQDRFKRFKLSPPQAKAGASTSAGTVAAEVARSLTVFALKPCMTPLSPDNDGDYADLGTQDDGGSPQDGLWDPSRILHRDEQPIELRSGFQCPACAKTFKFRKHCRRHMVNHSGRKPFSCSRCGRSYSRKDTCQRHAIKCKSRVAISTRKI